MRPLPRLRILLPLLLLAPACASTQPTRARPRPATAKRPAVEASAAVVEASASTVADADGPAPLHPLPRLLPGERVVGMAVEDLRGEPLGRVSDVLFDSETGDVQSLVVESENDGQRQAPDSQAQPITVAFREVVWSTRAGELVVRLTHGQREDGTPQRGDYRALFARGEEDRLTGQVYALELPQPDDPAQEVLVKLREANNHFHRVLLGPARVTERAGLQLTKGRALEVVGVPTRDAKGKLWIARTVRWADARLELRDDLGDPTWSALDEEPAAGPPAGPGSASARELARSTLHAADRTTTPVLGYVLDWSLGRIAYVRVRLGLGERVISYDTVRRDAEGQWCTTHRRGELWELPDELDLVAPPTPSAAPEAGP